MPHRRGEHIHRTVTLLNSLLRGDALDVHAVMKKLGLQKAGARRHLDALEKLAGVVRMSGKRARTLMLKLSLLEPKPTLTAAFAACVGAGFATLFAGAPKVQAAFSEVRDMVLQRARPKGTFRNLERKFQFLAAGGEIGFKENPNRLDDVITALVEEERIAIDYEHGDGRVETVKLEPLSLVVYQHQLYLVGRDPQQPSRVWPYRYARISEVRMTEETFTYPPVSQYSPDRMFATSFGIFVSEDYPVEQIKVRLSGDKARYANRHQWHPSQEVVMNGTTAVVSFRMKACPEVLSWLLSLGADAEVLEPTSLRDRVAEAAGMTAKLYAVPPG